tara:strand:+ start:61506 stop:61724 length:219 start_codon:yes stop_codon:yes gene_type:complete
LNAPIFKTSERHGGDPENSRTKEDRKMKLIHSYASWRKYRETCVELNRLSERELSDIGMSRGDIPFAARRAL